MTFRKISLTFLIIAVGLPARMRRRRTKVRSGSPTYAGTGGAGGSSHCPGKGADQGHSQAHAAGRNLHPEHANPTSSSTWCPSKTSTCSAGWTSPRALWTRVTPPAASRTRRDSSRARLDAMPGLTKALGLEKFTYNPDGFMQMMFLDPSGFDKNHYVFSYVRREFLGIGAHLGLRCSPQGQGHGPLLSGASGLKTRTATSSASTAPTPAPAEEDSSKYYFHFDSWRMNVQPGDMAAGCRLRRRDDAHRGRKNGWPEGADPLLGLLPQAAHARQRKRQRQGGRRSRQQPGLAGCGSAAGLARLGYAG